MVRWVEVTVIVIAAMGCTFDTGGLGPGKASLGSTSDDDADSTMRDDTSASDSSATTSTMDTDGGASASSSEPATASSTAASSTGPGSALLEISDGPLFDFGSPSVGSSTLHTFMVSNTGDAGATSIVAPELPSPYAFAGGAFPGTGGDCGDSLAARETCTMVVEFAPQLFGTATQELSLDYDSPEGPAFVAVDLTGIGAGTSENLIVNPGGELGGAPPVGWTEAVGDDWTVYDDFSRSGDYCIVGGLVQGQPGTYRLEQTFSLSSHVDVIDHQAGLAIAYAGYARTWSQNDDIYRFSLRTLDGSGNVVDSIETPDGTGSSWSLRELDLVTKPGVREVEIQVICIFNAGSACDAFFDDLSLTLSYPPA